MDKRKAILFNLGGTMLYPDVPLLADHLRKWDRQIRLQQCVYTLSVASDGMAQYMGARRLPMPPGHPYTVRQFPQNINV